MLDIPDRLRTAIADRYVIEEEIGRGGAATVYLAEDLKHARKVAIKVLRPDTAGGYEPQRFLREIRIAARLAHPQILPLHDSGEWDGLLYFVMPYAGCESLRDRLVREGAAPGRRGPSHRARGRRRARVRAPPRRHPPRHQARKHPAARGRAGGRRFRRSPRRISAAGGDNVYVTDRGFAVGTPAYMSPEQASAESRGRRADGSVQPRLRALRDAGGRAAVRRDGRAGDHGASRHRGADADPAPPSDRAGGRRAGARPGARQVAGATGSPT